jgi:dipeptidyl aminopeptidase/acylaminoacyl peptidase
MRRAAVLGVLFFFFCSSCGGESAQSPPPKRTSVFGAIASASPKTATPPAAPKPVAREDASLLPRNVLFANPDRAMPLVSPDGKRISYLSNLDGVLNVWVAPIDDLSKAKAVTSDKKRGVRRYKWAYTNDHIVYLQDEGGDENWHIHAVDLKTNADKDLTPYAGAQAKLEGLSWKIPNEVLVGINDRDKKWHDLYRIDIKTGTRTLVQKNDGFGEMHADHDYRVRFLVRPEKDGSQTYLDAKSKELFKVPHEDTLTTHVAGFDKNGTKAFLVDSRERNTAALVELDVASNKTKVVLDDGQADVTDVVLHPTEKKVQAALATYERLRWHVVDPSIRADLDLLAEKAPGDLALASRSLDDSKWVVSATVSNGPVKTYLYDRKKKTVEFLFSNMKALEDKKLFEMKPVVIKARDGLDLVSYLTRPTNDQPSPMVLLVHGGPWARDEWRFHQMHQWLATRGYAVLSVNYRGSTGFGKKFVNAADKEWAGKMHDDLLDAVAWAVKENVTTKDRVAIMGGSYGGYATLVGMTFTPDTFACGVDIVGPSNLATLLQSIPPYWESEIENFTKRIGDHRTEDGKKFLFSRSPLSRAERIARPLLIGQGANDPRVKQAESDQIVKAMRDKKIPVTYVLYPDEGHGFVRPENRTSFNAVAEVFLAQCLGGAYEPFGRDLKGSTIRVPAGAEHVLGLQGALPQ